MKKKLPESMIEYEVKIRRVPDSREAQLKVLFLPSRRQDIRIGMYNSLLGISLRRSYLKLLVSTFKTIALLLIISLNWVGLFSVGETVAYYFDVEISNGNLFGSSKLDFILEPEAPQEGEIDYGGIFERDIKVTDIASISIPFDIQAKVKKTGGSDDFCDALDISAFLEGIPIASGGLINFVSPMFHFSDLADDWQFIVELPAV